MKRQPWMGTEQEAYVDAYNAMVKARRELFEWAKAELEAAGEAVDELDRVLAVLDHWREDAGPLEELACICLELNPDAPDEEVTHEV